MVGPDPNPTNSNVVWSADWFGSTNGTITSLPQYTKAAANARADAIAEAITVCLRPKPRWMPEWVYSRLVSRVVELHILRQVPTVMVSQCENGDVHVQISISSDGEPTPTEGHEDE